MWLSHAPQAYGFESGLWQVSMLRKMVLDRLGIDTQSQTGRARSTIWAASENALRLGVDIEVVLLDRRFNSVDNILEMESLGVAYIMPLRGTDKLSRIIEEVDAGGRARARMYDEQQGGQAIHVDAGGVSQEESAQERQDRG